MTDLVYWYISKGPAFEVSGGRVSLPSVIVRALHSLLHHLPEQRMTVNHPRRFLDLILGNLLSRYRIVP